MHIYTGYFKSLDNKDYKVMIVPTGNDGVEEEILLGSSPFNVEIETGGSPFEPLRKSTATISIVSESYHLDMFSPKPMGTEVYLTNLTDNEIEWHGYLKPNLYNQPYENCMEEIDLEASDCLSALQYISYSAKVEGVKSIVDFKHLLDFMCSKVGITDIYIHNTHTASDKKDVMPESLLISEKNFFSSDTDEAWDCETLMEEMMKFMGYTALMWKGCLYMIDYSAWSSEQYGMYILQEMSYRHYTVGETGSTSLDIPAVNEINSYNFRGTGGNVSMDNIYNKITVKDSLYEVENVLPDILGDDDKLTPRTGDRNIGIEMPIVQEKICNSSGKFVDDAKDSKYQYFDIYYDHPAFESVYYDQNLIRVTNSLSASDLASPTLGRSLIGGTIVDAGNVHSTEYTYDISSSLDYKRYLYLNIQDKNQIINVFTYKLKDSEDQDFNEFVKINYKIEEPSKYLTMFRLKSGYHLPMLIGDETFLVLNTSAIFERHGNGYINPDWSSEDGGWYKGCSSQRYWAPKLIFVLGIGNQWWNGTAWQDTECAFLVPLQYDRDDDMKCTGKDWNTEMSQFNNVKWSDWSAANGVKIPMQDVKDLLGEIKFEVKMPPKTLYYSGGTNKGKQNGSVWITELSMDIVEKNSKLYEDKDIVYENVIDEDNVNEYDEQEFKITTWPGYGNPSYSHVGYATTQRYFRGFYSEGLTGRLLNAEKTLMEKLYMQYSSPTRTETLTLDMSYTPMMKIHDNWWDEDFMPAGTSINYADGNQEISLIQVKTPIYDNWLTMTRTDVDSTAIPYYGGTVTVEVDSAYPYKITCSLSGATTDIEGDGYEPTKHEITIPSNIGTGTVSLEREITITVKNSMNMTASLKLTQAGYTRATYTLHFDNTDCIGCTACDSYFVDCPFGINMTTTQGQKATINNLEACTGCEACRVRVESCPAVCFNFE